MFICVFFLPHERGSLLGWVCAVPHGQAGARGGMAARTEARAWRAGGFLTSFPLQPTLRLLCHLLLPQPEPRRASVFGALWQTSAVS